MDLGQRRHRVFQSTQDSTEAARAGKGEGSVAVLRRIGARATPSAFLGLGSLIVLAAWVARFGPLGPRLPGLGAVQALGAQGLETAAAGILAAVLAALAVAWLTRRLDGIERCAGSLALATVSLIGVSLTFTVGHLPLLLAGAALLALLLTVSPLGRIEGPSSTLGLPGLLYVLTAAAHAVFSMYRHWSFGSGSWDLGCMVHNFYLSSRGLGTTSTVLGGVDFLGDHFMVGIYLLAPIFWVAPSAWTVLAVQSLSLAVTAPAIYGIARHRGASPRLAFVLGLATGLSFGLQSAAYFDAHAITIGFGLLPAALWALERDRLPLASLLLALFATFKESLGAYVVGLGLLLVWRAYRDRSVRKLTFGGLWVLGGTIWFVLVNRVFMPAFMAKAARLESHETFADFGPTVFSALLGMLSDPLTTIGALFVPDEKALSLGVTLAGSGALAVFAPEVLLAALPLLAERFLSSKATMWQMGYHYAAPLCLYAGWAAALGIPKARAVVARGLEALSPGRGRRASNALVAYLLIGGLLVNAFGYRHRANFHRWREDYFSRPDRRAANAAAVAHVQALGRDVSVAAQNRILPHLADRAEIWRLGDYEHAEVVVLSIGESAWPWDDGYPSRLDRQLERRPEWTRIFEEGNARVWRRTSAP